MVKRFFVRQLIAIVVVLGAVNWFSGNASVRQPSRFFYGKYLAIRMDAFPQIAQYYSSNILHIPNHDKLEEIAEDAAARYKIDPYIVKALIEVESSFRIYAVSPRGACGLMQLLPSTGKELGVINPFDPYQNVDGGVKYLQKLLTIFKGDLWAALVAYNWGPARIRKVKGTYSPAMEKYLKKILKARFKYYAADLKQ